MNNKDLKRRVTIGLILITVGIFVLLNNYIAEKRELVFSEMNLELTEILLEENTIIEDTPQEEIEDIPIEENSTVPTTTEPQQNTTYETYAGILNIPKIGFSKGFYKKGSSLNNVKFNLKILDESDYPNKDKGNVIIIGHSGNYNNSYFANLYKLKLNDTASIIYNNRTYNYKIVDIYTEQKDGVITIKRNETKTCLTLITCTKDDDTTQTVYILELTNVEIGG